MDEACKVACGGFVVSVCVGLIPVSRPVFTAGGVIGVVSA